MPIADQELWGIILAAGEGKRLQQFLARHYRSVRPKQFSISEEATKMPVLHSVTQKAEWINGILGLWLIVAAFIRFGHAINLANNTIVGLVVAITAATIVKQKPWQGWLTLIVGVWMIIAGFITSLVDATGYMYNDLISGIIITIGGFASRATPQSHEKVA